MLRQSVASISYTPIDSGPAPVTDSEYLLAIGISSIYLVIAVTHWETALTITVVNGAFGEM